VFKNPSQWLLWGLISMNGSLIVTTVAKQNISSNYYWKQKKISEQISDFTT
jgi:hypothetical protein